MAMRKPVILGVRGESEQLLEESGGGLCVPPENPAQLARAVRRLHADRAECRAMGEAGRRFVEANFDRQVLAARYAGLLESVVARARAGATAPSPGVNG